MKCACGAEAGDSTRCKPCFAKYMRDYRKTEKTRAARRNYLRGCYDAQVLIVRTFQELGDAELNGSAAAEIAKRLCFT